MRIAGRTKQGGKVALSSHRMPEYACRCSWAAHDEDTWDSFCVVAVVVVAERLQPGSGQDGEGVVFTVGRVQRGGMGNIRF